MIDENRLPEKKTLEAIAAMLEKLIVSAERTHDLQTRLEAMMLKLEQRMDDLVREVQALRMERVSDDDLSPGRVIQ